MMYEFDENMSLRQFFEWYEEVFGEEFDRNFDPIDEALGVKNVHVFYTYKAIIDSELEIDELLILFEVYRML